MRRIRIRRATLVWLTIFIAFAWVVTRRAPIPLLIAAVAVVVMFKIGFAMLGGLAMTPPEPPPKGELRKVHLVYRCSLCGTEVRMTNANDEVPDAPRHCMEDMDLIATAEDRL